MSADAALLGRNSRSSSSMHEVDLDESIDDPDELYLRWPQHNTPRVRNSISILDEDFESGEMARAPPFDVDDELNRCLTLARRASARRVDAVVVGNNEALSDRSHHRDVFARGGPSLARVAALEGCRTGEAKLTRGHDLPARHAYTVGPRYQARYTDAAESALHWCYRGSLQLCAEAGARSSRRAAAHRAQGLPARGRARRAAHAPQVPRAPRRLRPRDPGGRRWRERKWLRRARGVRSHRAAHFPRTAAEADASAREPRRAGDADGEVGLVERLITIGAARAAARAAAAALARRTRSPRACRAASATSPRRRTAGS